jgi:PAS domain S-box-containing protein
MSIRAREPAYDRSGRGPVPRGPSLPPTSMSIANADERPLGLLLGLGVVALLTALDLAFGGDRVVIAGVVLGPFITALLTTARHTVVAAAAALALVLLSGVWNDNFATADYVVRVIVVGTGGAFAVSGARARTQLAADRRRFRLLRELAEVADAAAGPEETVRRLGAALVPGMADACAIDVDREGTSERVAAVAHGRGAAAVEGALREQEPGVEELPAAVGAVDVVRVPLRSRGRALGTLTLATTAASGRRYDAEDRGFAQVLGGRVALALDNAGLFRELESLEAQHSAALDSLAEAVTMQDERGTLVYANQAAAHTLGFASAGEMLATPPAVIAGAFDTFTEDGAPLDHDDLPARRVLRGEAGGPLLVRAVHRASGEERWRLIKATGVHDADGRVRLAVTVIEDVTDVKRTEIAQRFLASAGALLASSLDYEETLAQVTRLAVPELADWCAVSMPGEDGFMRTVAVAHADPERRAFAREYNARYRVRVDHPTGTAQVFREGLPQVVNQISDELLEQAVSDPEQLAALRTLGMRAAMIVPMVAPGGVIGAISFVSAESGRTFGTGDLELAEELGRRAGTAVENARLYGERTRVARALQESLLPDALPEVPGLRLAALYRPAEAEAVVGGDFYDAFATPSGWMLAVGDVTGRGAAAAGLTGQARHTLRTAGGLLGDPAAAVTVLNAALAGRRDLSLVTVAAVLLEEDAGLLATIVCAGHPPPLLVRDGRAEAVGPAGPIAGAWPDASWEPLAVGLEAGDLLLLYTDGVLDAVGATGRFGAERLAAAVAPATDATDAVRRIRTALDAFELGAQADDTAVLAVEIVEVAQPVGDMRPDSATLRTRAG